MNASNWSTVKIAECFDPVPASVRVQARDYQPAGAYPIVDQGQELIGGWTDDPQGLVSDIPVIVFGDHTRVFKFIDFPFCRGADGTHLLKPKTGIDPRFFYYSCLSIDLPSRGYNRHFSLLKEQSVALPKEPEQRDISRCLQVVEQAVLASRDLSNLLLRVRAATLNKLFTCGLRGEVQKESEIGLLPQSWDCVPFGTVREWLQYGTSVRCTATGGKHPVLRIPNLAGGEISADDLKYCDLSDDEAENWLLKEGDLLFVRTNGVIERLGSCAVYEGRPDAALFASYLIRARLTPSLLPKFAAFFFGSERGTALVAGRATPAADGKYNLNTGIIDSLPVPLPPTLDEQQAIIEMLGAIDLKIQFQKKKRAALELLFRSLLRRLMTGEIRVSDLALSAHAETSAAQVVA
jgi:type I restriction enzyme, S subunit